MSEDLAAALSAHFGAHGLRRLDIAPPGPLRSPGLPVQVGVYFTAPSPTDPLSLGEYASQRGWSVPAAAAQLRIGTDGGAQFHIAPDRTVRAEIPGDVAGMAVNSDLTTFASGLLLLDRHLPAVTAAGDLEHAFTAYRQLRQDLLALDPWAFDDRESWWPRVLDDLRRPLNTGSSAAFEYLDQRGERTIATETSGPGLPHPEEMVWYRLQAEGIGPEQVTRVFCELEPCLMPGHYCSLWMARTFPRAEFTHRFDYGRTARSREAGIKALMTSHAESRRRSTPAGPCGAE